MHIFNYGADENYTTPAAAGVPTYENAVQVATKKRGLIGLYAFNNSAATIYLALWDSANAGADNGKVRLFPVAASGFINIASNGKRMENGIYLKAWTTPAASAAAGNVMLYDVDFRAYL